MKNWFKKLYIYLKENTENILKYVILSWTTLIGFFLSFAIIWFSVGLPQEDWALWVLFAIAICVEHFYLKWLSND